MTIVQLHNIHIFISKMKHWPLTIYHCVNYDHFQCGHTLYTYCICLHNMRKKNRVTTNDKQSKQLLQWIWLYVQNSGTFCTYLLLSTQFQTKNKTHSIRSTIVKCIDVVVLCTYFFFFFLFLLFIQTWRFIISYLDSHSILYNRKIKINDLLQ